MRVVWGESVSSVCAWWFAGVCSVYVCTWYSECVSGVLCCVVGVCKSTWVHMGTCVYLYIYRYIMAYVHMCVRLWCMSTYTHVNFHRL